jgi:hypothetical protein
LSPEKEHSVDEVAFLLPQGADNEIAQSKEKWQDADKITERRENQER